MGMSVATRELRAKSLMITCSWVDPFGYLEGSNVLDLLRRYLYSILSDTTVSKVVFF